MKNHEKHEKKVMMFILEGPSDEAAIGSIMKEFFSAQENQFLVVHGDVTLKDHAAPDNILVKLNELVERQMERYRYQPGDIARIIHLVDIDGVFINDDRVMKANVGSVRYFEDHVETRAVDGIVDRNHRKAEVLYKLHRTGRLGGIPYRIYYNSCNLEHVLYNVLQDVTDEEKEEWSDSFAEQYEGKVSDFIEFINREAAVPGTFQQTWKFIEKDLNSLRRYTNMHQIFSD